MSISSSLEYLNETKRLIKEAIKAKGIVVLETDTFRSYAQKIGLISGGGGGDDTTFTLASIVGTSNNLFRLYQGAAIDDGSFTIDLQKAPYDKFKDVLWPISYANIGNIIEIWHDLYVKTTIGTIEVNKRDGSVTEVWAMAYDTVDAGKVLKIRWKGQAIYNNYTDSETQIHEVFLFDSGDAMLYIEKAPNTVSGSKYFFGQTFTPFYAGMLLTFYRQSVSGSAIPFNQVEEMYSASKSLLLTTHKDTYASFSEAVSLYMQQCKIVTSAANDDGSFNVPLSGITWRVGETAYGSITVSGNSWMSHNTSESIKLNRRDAKYTALRHNYGKVGQISFEAVQWYGYAHYSATTAIQEWTCYFLSNGDAFIVLSIQPSSYWDGVFNFYGTAYTISKTSPIVSFYRKNVEGTSYTAVNAPYDPSLSNNLVDTEIKAASTR